MANYCGFKMKITGKPKNIIEFVKIIHPECNYTGIAPDRHLFRIFDANVDTEEFLALSVADNETDIFCYVDGSCAWSISSCMTDDPFSSYSQQKRLLSSGTDEEKRSTKSKGTTLEIESGRLNLTIEVYGEEPGCGFEEHYAFVNGKTVTNEVEDATWYCIDDYESLEELNEEEGTEFTEDDFDEDNYAKIGGFEEWVFDEFE